jgi:hypothetical protein
MFNACSGIAGQARNPGTSDSQGIAGNDQP